MATKHQLTLPTEGISCHAWNGDRSMLAVCPNNNEIHIYGNCHAAFSKWEKLHVLGEHDLLISGIDWCPTHNKIVSCSHDRNAFVWTFDEGTNVWKPTLVILRIDRAALQVKWSHDGIRFAVTSGAKAVPVCTYVPLNDWWVSKMIKKKIFKSSVTCCAFHPSNGQILATGSTDFKCRIFSTFTSDVDGSPNAGPFSSPMEFGEIYSEIQCSGWINGIAWSPSGHSLAFCGHDSSIHLVNFTAEGQAVEQVIKHKELPCTSVLFMSERAFIGAGHEFNPLLFNYSDAASSWVLHGPLEVKKVEAAGGATTGVAAARALFQNKSSRGQDKANDGDTLWTSHESAITCMQDASLAVPAKSTTFPSDVSVTRVSTSGLDGALVTWNLPTLNNIDFASLNV